MNEEKKLEEITEEEITEEFKKAKIRDIVQNTIASAFIFEYGRFRSKFKKKPNRDEVAKIAFIAAGNYLDWINQENEKAKINKKTD